MTQRPLLRVHQASHLPDDVISRWAQLWAASAAHPSPFLHPRTALTAASVVDDTEVAVVSHGQDHVAFLPFERRGKHGVPVAFDVSNGDGMVTAQGVEVPMPNLVRGSGLASLTWVHRDVVESPLSEWDHFVSDAAMVDLADGYDAYAAAVGAGSSVLKQAGRKSRKMGREIGEVTFELLDDHGLARTLVERKAAQLVAVGSDTPLAVDGATALIEAFGRTWTGAGFQSALSVLRAGDRIVAMTWGIAAGGRFVSCVPWYDEDLASYSPGLVLHVELLRQLERIDVTLVDLGLGIDQTKQRLLTHRVPLAGGEVWASAPRRMLRRARTIARQRVRGY